MPSQEDYANVILALSTLASAPVAAYPESGAMMLAKQGQDRAVGKLADEAMKKAQKKAKKKGKMGSIGQIAGMAAGAALAAPTGGMSLLAGAGLGGQVGGALGNLAGGGTVDPVSLAQTFAESKSSAEAADQASTLTAVRQPMQSRRNRRATTQKYNELGVLDPGSY